MATRYVSLVVSTAATDRGGTSPTPGWRARSPRSCSSTTASDEATAGAQSTPAGTHPAALFPRVANPCPEEPDAGILHVRIRGGRGRATSRGYPSQRQEDGTMSKGPGPGKSRPTDCVIVRELSVAALFTILWDALVDLLGIAETAAATIPRTSSACAPRITCTACTGDDPGPRRGPHGLDWQLGARPAVAADCDSAR